MDPIALPTRRTPGCPFDPPPELVELSGPLTRLAFPDGHVGWLVTGHEAARAVLSDPRFSVRSELKHSPFPRPNAAPDGAQDGPAPGWFAGMDRPEHTRYRRLLTGAFTVHRMRRLGARVAGVNPPGVGGAAARGA